MTDSISQTARGVDRGVLARRFADRLPHVTLPGGAKWVALAPHCLDVMGGIAELTGSLTLSTPLNDGVHVVVAARDDERIRVEVVEAASDQPSGNGHGPASEWALATLYDAGTLIRPQDLGARTTAACKVRLAVLAVAHALLRSGAAPHLRGGFTVAVDLSSVAQLDCRQVAVIQAAMAAALTRALGLDCNLRELADACRAAQCDALGYPVGIATQAAPLLAEGGRLLQVCCRPFEVGEALPIPSGAALVGIDCGVRHPAADEKYLAARTAALMGREIIARLVAQTSGGRATWDGYLARVSVTDYVDQLRDRIPTKLKGALYLERFGPLPDDHAVVEPHLVYKVRSRAEHHIYEDDRVRQFAERMARTARTGIGPALREAGELMYASHWSYGQRCGLGSIETDLLVNLLRREGDARGVHGARISGPGAGGMVAVLLEDTPDAFDAVRRAMAQYQQRTGHVAALHACAAQGTGGLAVVPSA